MVGAVGDSTRTYFLQLNRFVKVAFAKHGHTPRHTKHSADAPNIARNGTRKPQLNLWWMGDLLAKFRASFMFAYWRPMR